MCLFHVWRATAGRTRVFTKSSCPCSVMTRREATTKTLDYGVDEGILVYMKPSEVRGLRLAEPDFITYSHIYSPTVFPVRDGVQGVEVHVERRLTQCSSTLNG
jgi:hypothetical protein